MNWINKMAKRDHHKGNQKRYSSETVSDNDQTFLAEMFSTLKKQEKVIAEKEIEIKDMQEEIDYLKLVIEQLR